SGGGERPQTLASYRRPIRYLKLWQIATEREILALPVPAERQFSKAAFNADGRLLALSEQSTTAEKMFAEYMDKFAANLRKEQTTPQTNSGNQGRTRQALDSVNGLKRRDSGPPCLEPGSWACGLIELMSTVGLSAPKEPVVTVWEAGRQLHALSGHMLQ